MEFEFDKEMDSLLRQSAKSDILFPKQNANTEHIDADEISMFAENALPEKAKPSVIKHLADCDRCRTVLSNVIVLNAEDEKAVVPITTTNTETVVASTEPSWFQKLLSTRNLAFGMGALAVIFAVGIGFVAIQNLSSGNNEMAKATSSESKKIDNKQTEALSPNLEGQNANSSLDSDTKLVSESNDEAKKDSSSETKTDKANETSENSVGADTVANEKSSAPKDKEKPRDKNSAKKSPKPTTFGDRSPEKITTDAVVDVEESDDRDKTENNLPKARGDSPAKPKQVPPSAPVRKRRGKVKNNRAEEKKDSQGGLSTGASKISSKSQVGNKTFTRKKGVWTDSAYKGQKTTNVKRDTSQYRKLDSGLQSIGNKLSGTVIVVWKSKAYKIQ